MSKKRHEIKKPPIWIMISTFLAIMGVIFTAIIGINKIQNYYHPYWFGLIFGGFGIILGVWTAFKLKPIIGVNQRLKNDNKPMPAHNISYPSSAAAVVFGGHLSAQAAYRLDRKSPAIRPCV